MHRKIPKNNYWIQLRIFKKYIYWEPSYHNSISRSFTYKLIYNYDEDSGENIMKHFMINYEDCNNGICMDIFIFPPSFTAMYGNLRISSL